MWKKEKDAQGANEKYYLIGAIAATVFTVRPTPYPPKSCGQTPFLKRPFVPGHSAAGSIRDEEQNRPRRRAVPRSRQGPPLHSPLVFSAALGWWLSLSL